MNEYKTLEIQVKLKSGNEIISHTGTNIRSRNGIKQAMELLTSRIIDGYDKKETNHEYDR